MADLDRRSDSRSAPGVAAMDNLLVTKLSAPRPRHNVVERGRLLRSLADAVREGGGARLILVSAPAGFGKTTLLGEWRQQMAGAVDFAWVALDDYDNDPTRAWRHVIAAVEAAIPARVESAPQALQSTPPQIQSAISALINQLAAHARDHPRPLVIALDDYQCITEPAVHESIAFALDHLPARVHLALLTRADPPFGLTRLRVRGELFELRGEHLSFELDETRAFMRDVMALDVDEGVLNLLQARTEGWPAAVHLAALAVKGRRNPSARLAELLEADQFIFDYLAEEVLRHQPEAVRQFLLRTSVLATLSPALCDALTGRTDGAKVLARLHHDGLFIAPLDARGEFFRYHPLFAEALRDLLGQTEPAIVPELHRRASDWHLEHDHALEAIHHARLADDFDRMTSCIARSYRELIQSGDLATLMRLLEEMPAERVEREPVLALAYAWSHIYAMRFADLQRYLDIAQAAQGAGGAERSRIGSELLAMRAVFESVYGDPHSAAALCDEALAAADPDDALPAMVIQQALGNVNRSLGRPAEAIQAYERARRIGAGAGWHVLAALALARQGQMHIVAGRLRAAAALLEESRRLTLPDAGEANLFAPEVALLLAGCHCEWNAAAEAKAWTERGLALAQEGNNRASLAYHAGTAARAFFAAGEPEAARAIAERAVTVAAQARSPLLMAVTGLHAAVVAFRLQDYSAAEAWAMRYAAGELDPPLPPLYCDDADLLVARVHALRGHWRDAAQAAHGVASRAESAGRMRAALEARVVRALALQGGGCAAEARDALIDALARAAPEGFVRIFLDEGEPMLRLLREARAALQRAPLKRGLALYAGRLLIAAGEAAGDEDQHGLIEPLTPRELQILRLVAQGASNGEIAARLIISPGTVKAHTNRIYGKLGARNRTEAAARARDLALVDVE